MNPGLVVKLRPAGPWRIGPDSGARNKVDAIYHSDSLYAAVTSAMARLGSLAEWLDATARSATPEVCFSSCFPFVDELALAPPPRTVWPPSGAATRGARVRWKSARFVPLEIVQSILAGERLDDNHWTVDGGSECLVPAGRQGPFRTGVRWNAAVDRLSGATERHSTACLEFRPGAGLWTVVSFRDDGARTRWIGPVQAAFRWLADSGFGGERSRGWGRAEAPEFVDGMLPEMILGAARDRGQGARKGPAVAEQGPAEEPSPVPPVEEPPSEEPPVTEPGPEEAPQTEGAEVSETPLAAEGPAEAESTQPPAQEDAQQRTAEVAGMPESPATGEGTELQPVAAEEPKSVAQEAAQRETPEIAGMAQPPAAEEPQPAAQEAAEPEAQIAGTPESVAAEPRRQAPGKSHWLLSLFTPAADDSVDWTRGNYTLLTRSGRVDASGELKKQLAMVAEGSVVYAPEAPRGSAPDVAPDGFAHPVFRAGFALSIPLPEVAG